MLSRDRTVLPPTLAFPADLLERPRSQHDECELLFWWRKAVRRSLQRPCLGFLIGQIVTSTWRQLQELLFLKRPHIHVGLLFILRLERVQMDNLASGDALILDADAFPRCLCRSGSLRRM